MQRSHRRGPWLAATAVAVAGLLTTACSSTSGDGAPVVGQVVAAPACPVEVEGSPCPPRPVDGAQVTAERDGDVVARTVTETDGSFRMTLAPGTYTVTATTVDGLASRASVTVTVPLPSGRSPLVLTVDSGIR